MKDNKGRFKKGHSLSRKGFNQHYFLQNILFLIIKDKLILIDAEDYEKINKYRWGLDTKNYVRHYSKKNIQLTRLIMDCPKDKIVDHINHDTLDNRKSNLRIVNKRQNAYNAKKRTIDNTSIYKGVSFKFGRNKWRSYITVDSKTIHLGHFNTEIEAAKAYNEAAIKYHKEFAYLNKLE